MKIEMDDNTSVAICWTATCMVLVLISLMIYRYNALVYEQGYTQKQLQNSQMTYWAKEK